MDAETERRWRDGLPPFDGLTVTTHEGEGVPIAVLRAVLFAVIPYLEERWQCMRLHTLHDWHAHDGFITQAWETSWEDLRARLATEETLRAAGSGDTLVSIALFPETWDFYLRFDPFDNSDSQAHGQPWGDFDITCSIGMAHEIAALASQAGAGNTVIEGAKGFFDRRYAG